MSGAQHGVQTVQVPAAIVAQIQMQTINTVANAIVRGDYEGSEVIPDAHKKIIGEMLITLTRNRALETAKCENCGEIRLKHNLDLSTGNRPCAPEHQPMPTVDDPTLIPMAKTFSPMMQRIVTPEAPGKIILPGR